MSSSGSVDWMAVLTLIAILIGPILAVMITRFSDNRREIRARKMDIFRALMRTRRMPIHFEHVGALNLIEIEFHKDKDVISAWKKYFENLCDNISPESDGRIQTEFMKKRDSLHTKLLHEISKSLGFSLEQLDILEGSYLPQGWSDEDFEQRIIRKSMIDVLGGRRPILFKAYVPSEATGPYPPAPTIECKSD